MLNVLKNVTDVTKEKQMIKRFIEQEMLASDSWSLFGAVNLSLMRDTLRTADFKRIPNDERLKSIIREINDKHSDLEVNII